MTVVAMVDKDYINDEGDEEFNRCGSQWTVESIENSLQITLDLEGAKRVRFRLKDDDGEICYGGWLFNDAECTVQEAVLEWGKYDTGCTTIEVHGYSPDTEWRQDIG